MAHFRHEHRRLFAPFSGCVCCPSAGACPGAGRARALAESEEFAREVARHTLGLLAGALDGLGVQQGVTKVAATRVTGRPTREEIIRHTYCAFAQASQRYLEARGRHYGFSQPDAERVIREVCGLLAGAFIGQAAKEGELAELRALHRDLCRPLYLLYEGCERCAAQCLYGYDVQQMATVAHDGLAKAFKEESEAGSRTVPEALNLAKRLIASKAEQPLRQAAYCLLASAVEALGFEKSGAMLEFFSKKLGHREASN